MNQTGEGELPFDNVPKDTEDVQLSNDIHSPLLGKTKVVKKGWTLVFGCKNAHIVKGITGELIIQIMEKAQQKDSDKIIITFNLMSRP